MGHKKVLIISYYWPPSAGAGVQRWLKFSKYLRNHGWEPVVYTPENPEFPGYDYSLSSEIPEGMHVIKKKIREPYQLYRLFTGRKSDEKFQAGFLDEYRKQGVKDRMATWLRGNLFIPDARKWWVNPSAVFLKQWLMKHPVDVMVSTGPPHSMHLIALRLKQSLSIPWLADFRDPWTGIDFYPKLMLSSWADGLHRKMERKVLQHADRVVTISKHCAMELDQIGNRSINIITNGYDPDDFQNLPAFNHDAFSITHLGSMNADRNPVVLWQVLEEMLEKFPVLSEWLCIRLIGKTDISVKQSLEKHGLLKYARFIPYLPHREAIEKAASSAILLLALNNAPNALGIAPGKLYEYLGLRRPILCIGPEDGDAADIIKRTGAGHVAGFENREKTTAVLSEMLEALLNNSLIADTAKTEAFTRPFLTGELAKLLDAMTDPGK